MSVLALDQSNDVMKIAREHLEASRKRRNKNQPDYGRWEYWAKFMYESIGSLKDPVTVLRFAQAKIPFTHREEAKIDLLSVYFDLLVSMFPKYYANINEMSDDARSIPNSLASNKSRFISNIYLWHLYTVFSCINCIGVQKRILEIGGGLGSIARLWMTNTISPIDRYVIVDIPESLYFAEVCLGTEFQGQVGYLDKTDPGSKILLVPIDRFEEYKKPSDLVINIGSMQEMNDNWTDYYMDWLDKYEARYFYSLNYGGSPIQDMGESRTFWSPRPGQQWSTLMLNPCPPVVKIMTRNRWFAEILYEKSGSRGSLRDWSVMRGMALSRATFLDGLDLVRQFPHVDYVQGFLNIVKQKNGVEGWWPKEVLYLARHAKDKDLVKKLESMIGGFNQ